MKLEMKLETKLMKKKKNRNFLFCAENFPTNFPKSYFESIVGICKGYVMLS